MSQPASRTVTIAVACLATAMLMLDISVINTALSDIAAGLDTGLNGLQWVVDAYTIPLAATVLTAGAIADRVGRRRLFLIGVALFTASSALCGAAGGIEMLVGARAIQGLGASMMFATALALISQVTPDRKDRMKALAAYGAAIGASFALGPFIGGALTEIFGWRAIFLVNVPIGVAALWVTYRMGRGGTRPHASAHRRSRAAHPDRRALPPGARPAARERRGLGKHRDRRVAGRRGGSADRLRHRGGALAGADASAAPAQAAPVRRSPGFGLRDRRVLLRRLSLPHALPAVGPRLLADRDGACVPAGNVPGVHRLRHDGTVRSEVLGREDRHPRARPRWGRTGPDAARRGQLVLDGAPPRAPRSPAPAPACSTRPAARSR